MRIFKKIRKLKLLKCDDCGEKKDDVESVFCPYSLDVYEEENEALLCGECYQERVWSI